MIFGRLGMLLCLLGFAVLLAPTLLERVQSLGSGAGPTDRSAAGWTNAAAPVKFPTDIVVIHTTTGALVHIRVAVADTAAKQETGLAGRSHLSPDQGMLFAFPRRGRPEFWMRGVSIPLSLAFIAADGTIVDLRDLNPLDDRRQSPTVDVDRALEVPRGFFSRTGVRVGDHVDVFHASAIEG